MAEVIAYDITPQMLAETARNAAERGLTNVAIRQGAAEHLPFADSSFDIVTVRHAPHHFADAAQAVREMARVAKPGGRVIIVDSRSPEDPALDREFNHIEKLRDPSHVRNYRPSEWRAMVTAAGLRITFEELDFYTENGRPMDFAAWTRRANTPPAAIAELARLFRDASPALIEALRIELGARRVQDSASPRSPSPRLRISRRRQPTFRQRCICAGSAFRQRSSSSGRADRVSCFRRHVSIAIVIEVSDHFRPPGRFQQHQVVKANRVGRVGGADQFHMRQFRGLDKVASRAAVINQSGQRQHRRNTTLRQRRQDSPLGPSSPENSWAGSGRADAQRSS